MAKPELEFHEPPADWRETNITGLAERILAADTDTDACSRLLRFEPGTDTTPNGTLVHDFWEEIYVISGDLTDTRLSQTFTQGFYACRPPGMEHGPWRSKDGALLFEVRYYVK